MLGSSFAGMLGNDSCVMLIWVPRALRPRPSSISDPNLGLALPAQEIFPVPHPSLPHFIHPSQAQSIFLAPSYLFRRLPERPSSISAMRTGKMDGLP
jgi:hypothetical protein